MGGLNDMVKVYNEYSGEGNGFFFKNYNVYDMFYMLERVVLFYYQKDVWKKLMMDVMS